MTRSAESQFYSVPEAARLLKVNPSTVWRWVAAEKLPAYRVGPRAIRIKKEDLETLLEPARQRVSVREHPPRFAPPTPVEIARRKAVVAQILARSDQRRIAPLTSAELVHQVRDERQKAYERWSR